VLEQASRIAQRQLSRAKLDGSTDAIQQAQRAVDAVAGLNSKPFLEQEANLQDAKLTSVFQRKGQLDQKGFQKQWSSSAVGRKGGFQPTPVIVEDDRTKEVLFRRAVDKALEEETLEELHKAWASWRAQSTADIPLDNRELAKVLEQASRIAQRQLSRAKLDGSTDAIQKAQRAVDAVAGLNSKPFLEQEAKLQDAKLTSVFQRKGQLDQKGFQKQWSSSAVGRKGGFQPTPVIVEDNCTKEVLFRRAVSKALAEQRLDGLQEAWVQWSFHTSSDVPLNNRELITMCRQVVDLAHQRLAEAVRLGNAVAIDEALRSADQVADVFPGIPEVRSSPHYKAARSHAEL
jgi:hypothetical protein